MEVEGIKKEGGGIKGRKEDGRAGRVGRKGRKRMKGIKKEGGGT